MAASDKLFYWVFQQHPDRILELVPELGAGGGGYRFSAPVLIAARLLRSSRTGTATGWFAPAP
jgi:hypothetical protein